VWTVLLGASDRNDDRPPSGADLIPELARGQLVEKHRLRRLGERLCGGQQQEGEQVPHNASNHGRILWDSWPIRQALRIAHAATQTLARQCSKIALQPSTTMCIDNNVHCWLRPVATA
jgi:hypothetical protein